VADRLGNGAAARFAGVADADERLASRSVTYPTGGASASVELWRRSGDGAM
jgi:hypothetical protein